MSIIKAADIRLKVRPVLLGLEHKYFYEGPCRFGQGEALEEIAAVSRKAGIPVGEQAHG